MWLIRSLVFLAALWAATLLAAEPGEQAIPREAKRSGYEFLGAATRAMQDDELANPGALWLTEGETLWNARAGAEGRSCADCHGAVAGMRGVAARYPRYDASAQRVLNLEQRINRCRGENQRQALFAWESPELLALTALVAHQSKGLPLNVDTIGPAQAYLERGGELFHRRLGQLNLSCAHCHDLNWGRRLAAETVSQGHPNAYPAYRLEWQTLGSLHRRLRSCNVGVRAQPFEPGSDEYVALELYLAWRAAGLPIESPGVRR